MNDFKKEEKVKEKNREEKRLGIGGFVFCCFWSF